MALSKRERLDKKKTKQLLECVSKDYTRAKLMGVCHEATTEALCATDGYRLTHLKSHYSEKLKGIIISPDDFRPLRQEYPNIKKLLPSFKSLTKGQITIEKHQYIKQTGKGFAADIKKAYLHKGKEEGQYYFSVEQKENAIIAVNASFLKVLADGSTYAIAFEDDKTPVIFSFEPRWDIKNAEDDFTLIMPIRID